MLRYNAKSYRRACCRSEKAYFNFINHIIPYTILTSTQFFMCLYNFRKYLTYSELVKFCETYELRSKWHVSLLPNYIQYCENSDISRTKECNSAKVSTTNPKVLPYTLYKHAPIQKVERLWYSVTTRWRKNVPFPKSVGVPKFKTIKRICMFDKVIVIAIQRNATHIWKWCLKFVLMVLPLLEKTRNEHALAKMSNVTFKQN